MSVDHAEEIAQWYDEEQPEPTTWEPVDLAGWLSGQNKCPEASVGVIRSDGQRVIYPGREHAVVGETEAGKSWFALACVAAELIAGHRVLYIHYEEGDPGSTVERLLLIGVPSQVILDRLTFVAPAKPARNGWLAELLDPAPVLVVHDGVNEAMSLHGDDSNATDGAATYRRNLIKPCLAAGAATLSLDHVTKNSEGRGRYAIGAGHKIAAIDGAAFMLENRHPFGRGVRGVSSVFVTKDRPGYLRANGTPSAIPGKTYFGTLVVDNSDQCGPDLLQFIAPSTDETKPSADPDAALADTIYELIAAQPGGRVDSSRQLFALVRQAKHGLRDTKVRAVVDDLLVLGRLAETAGKNRAKGYQVIPSSASHAVVGISGGES